MNSLLSEYDPESDDEEIATEFQEMGSFNHSYLQAKLAALFFATGQYIALTELSLDVSNAELEDLGIELKDFIKPDVCVYPKRKISLTRDILKMKEMPLLVIEILSPMQGVQIIIEKFKVYFALGIKSCWLVYPSAATVAVYSSLDEFKAFSAGDVVDERIGIRLPVAEIFS